VFNELIPSMSEIADRRLEMLRNAVSVPTDAVGHPKVAEALERAIQGKRPFPVLSFGSTEAKTFFQQIEVQGRSPLSTEDWERVKAYMDWRGEIKTFTGRWAAIREDFDLPSLENDGDRTAKWIAHASSLLQKASRVLQDLGPRLPEGSTFCAVAFARELSLRPGECCVPGNTNYAQRTLPLR